MSAYNGVTIKPVSDSPGLHLHTYCFGIIAVLCLLLLAQYVRLVVWHPLSHSKISQFQHGGPNERLTCYCVSFEGKVDFQGTDVEEEW